MTTCYRDFPLHVSSVTSVTCLTCMILTTVRSRLALTLHLPPLITGYELPGDLTDPTVPTVKVGPLLPLTQLCVCIYALVGPLLPLTQLCVYIYALVGPLLPLTQLCVYICTSRSTPSLNWHNSVCIYVCTSRSTPSLDTALCVYICTSRSTPSLDTTLCVYICTGVGCTSPYRVYDDPCCLCWSYRVYDDPCCLCWS